MIRSIQPEKRAWAAERSRTPASKWRRMALTVPNTARLPSTISRFQEATSTATSSVPPVTPERMHTPSSPKVAMAGTTTAAAPVASKTISKGPKAAASRSTGMADRAA